VTLLQELEMTLQETRQLELEMRPLLQYCWFLRQLSQKRCQMSLKIHRQFHSQQRRFLSNRCHLWWMFL
jgi:hypothetical protein